MNMQQFLDARLANHFRRRPFLDRPPSVCAADIARHMCAIQAQDYASAKWALGVRSAELCESDIDDAIAQRRIVRTWALRGTLHIVAAQDVHRLLRLIGPRVLARLTPVHRREDLHDAAFARIERILRRALAGGAQLTRPELFAILAKEGVVTEGERGGHILNKAALQACICLGPPRGKQATYTLLDEWVPAQAAPRDEMTLAELCQRYFDCHGPATLKDFAWWAGLTLSDARNAAQGASLHRERLGEQDYFASASTIEEGCGSVHLLPAFDEYFIAYADRQAIVDSAFVHQIMTTNGLFRPTLLVGGRIVGTWSRTVAKDTVRISLTPFSRLTAATRQAIEHAADAYGRFVRKPVEIV